MLDLQHIILPVKSVILFPKGIMITLGLGIMEAR